MVTRRLVRSSASALAGLQWPVFEASGAPDGPRACVLAGVHGCEYSSVAALVRFMRSLDVSVLTGSIVAVPIVSPTSFQARSPFVVPEDGRNLNRSFPGDPHGSFTDVLAHHVFSEFVSGSDFVIDLHGGDMVEALEPFALYDDSAVRETAQRLARAFGLRYVVCDTTDTLGGTTSAAAAAAGIPAFIAEAGGRGLLEPIEVERHIRGLRSALRAAGVLEGEPDLPPAGQRLVERFVWLRTSTAGWWQPAVDVGEAVAAGDRLGTVLDGFGDVIDTITAPEAGVPLFITSSPAVQQDGLLLGLGAGLREL
ncbi:MAG: succinylglutamate desuccinylase/aspartoacylase family protein [Solirubrobacteraceae bacterium]